MIEMRWLETREEPIADLGKFLHDICDENIVKKLQYRHLVAGVDKDGEMKMFADAWSEWKDVPVAKIEDVQQ